MADNWGRNNVRWWQMSLALRALLKSHLFLNNLIVFLAFSKKFIVVKYYTAVSCDNKNGGIEILILDLSPYFIRGYKKPKPQVCCCCFIIIPVFRRSLVTIKLIHIRQD